MDYAANYEENGWTKEVAERKSEVERKNYRNLRNLLKGTAENPKKEYLEEIHDELMEIPRTGHCDLM
jgi:hypothetical protein